MICSIVIVSFHGGPMSQTDQQIQKVVDARGLYLGYVVTRGGQLTASYPPSVALLLPPPPKVLTAEDIAVRDNLPRRPRSPRTGYVVCPKCNDYIRTIGTQPEIVTCTWCRQRTLAF
jgi:hypothetical protein